jgi:hypothetical protein
MCNVLWVVRVIARLVCVIITNFILLPMPSQSPHVRQSCCYICWYLRSVRLTFRLSTLCLFFTLTLMNTSYHVKYMFVGDGVKTEVEKVIRTLRPALQLRLRFIAHHGREEGGPINQPSVTTWNAMCLSRAPNWTVANFRPTVVDSECKKKATLSIGLGYKMVLSSTSAPSVFICSSLISKSDSGLTLLKWKRRFHRKLSKYFLLRRTVNSEDKYKVDTNDVLQMFIKKRE